LADCKAGGPGCPSERIVGALREHLVASKSLQPLRNDEIKYAC
jgi:hypothetical protein